MSNELDKQFSDRLRDYESAVDAESLWEAVKPTQKKRPWTWLWLLLLGGGVLLGTYWWYTDFNEENTIVAAINTIDEAGVETAEETTNKVEYEASHEERNTDTKSDTPEKIATDNLVSTTSSLDTNTIKPATAFVVPPITINTPISDAFAEKEMTTGTITTEAERNDLNLLLSGSKSRNASFGSALDLSSTVTREGGDFLASRLGATSPVPTLDIGLLPTSLNTKPPSFPSEENYLSKKSPWFLQLDAGYYALQRSLKSSNDSIRIDDWINKRKQTESLLEARSFDVTLGYELSERWELRTGVAYTQINTVFNYNITTSATDTIEGVLILVPQPNQPTDTIYGPVPRTTTTSHLKRTYNSFRQWEVPLLVAYNFGAGKLSYQAEAGVRLLVQRQWEGSILSESTEFVDLTEEDWYRNSLDLSLQAGLKAKYDLTARTAILAGLNARYSPQQFTTGNAPFKERYQLLGASISLRHKF